MKKGKIVVGAILILIAVWLAFISPTSSVGAKFLGGGIVAIIGISSIVSGSMKEGPKKEKEE